MGLDMEIYGDFNLSVGRKVGIIIPKPDKSESGINEGNKFTDKYIGGVYLVSSISHFFSPNDYRCSVGLQKDSLAFDLDAGIELGKDNNKNSASSKKRRNRVANNASGSKIVGAGRN